jgi:small subunit ribosomal protein S18
MASKKKSTQSRTRGKDPNPRKFKKKTSPLVIDKVEYVDYKDVDLLQRFISDRAKIRNRRVSGNDVQQQREVAKAIKVAREMALLPYAKRVASAGRGRPQREGDFRRDAEAAPAAKEGVDTGTDEVTKDTGVDESVETVSEMAAETTTGTTADSVDEMAAVGSDTEEA